MGSGLAYKLDHLDCQPKAPFPEDALPLASLMGLEWIVYKIVPPDCNLVKEEEDKQGPSASLLLALLNPPNLVLPGHSIVLARRQATPGTGTPIPNLDILAKAWSHSVEFEGPQIQGLAVTRAAYKRAEQTSEAGTKATLEVTMEAAMEAPAEGSILSEALQVSLTFPSPAHTTAAWLMLLRWLHLVGLTNISVLPTDNTAGGLHPLLQLSCDDLNLGAKALWQVQCAFLQPSNRAIPEAVMPMILLGP